jgi:hypothetical protein
MQEIHDQANIFEAFSEELGDLAPGGAPALRSPSPCSARRRRQESYRDMALFLDNDIAHYFSGTLGRKTPERLGGVPSIENRLENTVGLGLRVALPNEQMRGQR